MELQSSFTQVLLWVSFMLDWSFVQLFNLAICAGALICEIGWPIQNRVSRLATLTILSAVMNLSPLSLFSPVWKDNLSLCYFLAQFSLFLNDRRFDTHLQTSAHATAFHCFRLMKGFSCWLSQAWTCTSAAPAYPWSAPSTLCAIGASRRPCTSDWKGRLGPSWRHQGSTNMTNGFVLNWYSKLSSARMSSCYALLRHFASCGAWRLICAAWPTSSQIYQLAEKAVHTEMDPSQ